MNKVMLQLGEGHPFYRQIVEQNHGSDVVEAVVLDDGQDDIVYCISSGPLVNVCITALGHWRIIK